MSALDNKLTRLTRLSPPELRAEWIKITKKPVPKVGPTLLALGIAFGLQEKLHGGLSAIQTRELGKLSERYFQTGEIGTNAPITLKVGSLLVRDWHGEIHTVQITNDGFQYRDRQYRSLTHIACIITGTHWSGPRFFGLKSIDESRGDKGN